MYHVSIKYDSLIFYSLIIILLYMYIYQNIDSNLKYLYIFSLIIAILIASNFILYTILGVSLYLFFNNNIIDIIKDGTHSYIDDTKNFDD